MARELPRIERRNFVQISGGVSPVAQAIASVPKFVDPVIPVRKEIPIPEFGDPGVVGRAISNLGSDIGQITAAFAEDFQRTATIKEHNAANRSLLDANFQATQAAIDADDDPEVYRQGMNNWYSANKDKYSDNVWGKIDIAHADLSFQGVGNFSRITKKKDDAFNLNAYKTATLDLEFQILDGVRNGEDEVVFDLREHLQDYHIMAAENGLIDLPSAQNSMRVLDDKINIGVGQTQVDQAFDSVGYDAAQNIIDGREGVFADPDVRIKAQSTIDGRRTTQRREQARARQDLVLKQGKVADALALQIRNSDMTEAQINEIANEIDDNGEPLISTKSHTRLIDMNRAEVRRKNVIVRDFERRQNAVDTQIDKFFAEEEKVFTKEQKIEREILADDALIAYATQAADPSTPYPTREALSLIRSSVTAEKYVSLTNAYYKHHGIAAKTQIEDEAYENAYVNRLMTPGAEPTRTRKNEALINDPAITDQDKLLGLIDDSEVLGTVSKELGKFSKSMIAKAFNAANVKDKERASQIQEAAVDVFMQLRTMSRDSSLVYQQLPADVQREVDYISSQTQGSRVGVAEAIASRVEFFKRPVAVQRQLEKVASDVRLNQDYVVDNFEEAFEEGTPGPTVSNLMADFNVDYKRRILNGESVDDARASALVFVKSQWKEGLNEGRFMKFSPKAFQEKYLPGAPSNFPDNQFDRQYETTRIIAENAGFPMPPRDSVRIEATNNTRNQFSTRTSPEYAVVLAKAWGGQEAGERVLQLGNAIMTWQMKYDKSVEQREKLFADLDFKRAQTVEIERLREQHRQIFETPAAIAP